MFKTLGEYNWCSFLQDVPNPEECSINEENTKPAVEFLKDATEETRTVSQTAAEFHTTLENLKMVMELYDFSETTLFSCLMKQTVVK